MCVLRFKRMETDMLITLTTPISDRAEEAEARGEPRNAPINDDNNTNFSTFRQILKSFNITDWNILGTTTTMLRRSISIVDRVP